MSAYEMPGATARLVCDPGHDEPHVEVAVYDGRLEPLPLSYNLGRVEVGVVPGAYKVEFRTGAETRSRIAVVGDGEVREVALDDRLPVASAAPVDGSSTSHEYQMGPAAHESGQPPLPPPTGQSGGAHLFLFVRDHDEAAASGQNPAEGLSLHALDGRMLYDLGRAEAAPGPHGLYDAHGRWTALHADLDPGAYLLRLETAVKGVVQQVVHVRAGWQTQLFLLARSYGRRDERRRQADLARASVFMARAGSGFRPGERHLYLTEVALRALADGRSVPGADPSEMLWEKFENPMLGLYGAFLHLRRDRMDPVLMETVFGNLLRLLGPHPDLLALGCALEARWRAEGHPPEALGRVRAAVEAAGPVTVPPMLRAAWDAVASASFSRAGLVAPDSLAERVTTRMVLAGPWLMWTATPDELREASLPPPAAPSVASIVDRVVGTRSKRARVFRVMAEAAPLVADVVNEWAGERNRGEDGGPDDGDPQAVLRRLQQALEIVTKRLDDWPELAARLAEDPSLTPLQRRVALAAFPQTDPLFLAMTRRGSRAAAALMETTRPTAADLAATLRVPAGTLLRALLGLAATVAEWLQEKERDR